MYIVDFKRTPIGKFLGSLSHLSSYELARPLFSYFLKTYPFLLNKTDEVIMGGVLTAGVGMNPARIASVEAGISTSVPAYIINQVCASGMNAIIQGFRSIRTEENHLVLAGGMESMSQAPYIVKGARQGLKFGSKTLVDSLYQDGLYCALSKKIMGITAEHIAKKFEIKREDQDQYAFKSHQKALKSQNDGMFLDQIISVADLKKDESPRIDTSLKKLALLKPFFKSNGSVTAGNSSGINDGAALLLLASEKALKKYQLTPLAKIRDSVFIGLNPELMGLGPIYAINKLLKRNNLKIQDIDLFEINEAFAVHVLVVMRELKIDDSKINIFGGAIALGHPLGMSGARIVGNLCKALKKKKSKLGIAALCVGGGQGVAVLIEKV
jgi:acetyl-CoA C-acetyltransferase